MRIMVQVDDWPPRDIMSTPWAAYADVLAMIAGARTKSGRLRARVARENAVLGWAFPPHRPPFDDVVIVQDEVVIHAFGEGMAEAALASMRAG